MAAGVGPFRNGYVACAPNLYVETTEIGTVGANMGTSGTVVTLAANASETVAVNDLLLIEEEIVKVTTVTNQASFVVTRAQNETTAATHAIGSEVYLYELDTDDAVATPGVYKNFSPWFKNVSWPIDNEGGDASGMGTAYRETTPGEKPREGPITFDFMKSFSQTGPDRFLEPLARSGGPFWVKIRNEGSDGVSETNPQWEGQVHSLNGYMPATADEGRTDAARVSCTMEISTSMTRSTS